VKTGILAQVQIAEADVEQELYTVPASYWAGISTILICNQAATVKTFSLRVRPTFETDPADKQFIFKECPVPGNDTFEITVGLVLGPVETLRIVGSTTGMSATVFGWEKPV